MDETRIDAAPTPAHVFAYRAFRSVFVRSPESSPVQPRDILDDSDRNKENTRNPAVRGSRFLTSPIQAKRKDVGVDLENLAISLTPKRQKIVPVSPTKSILKNPHAPTPRRAELRDVTVTFKDLRKSVSPQSGRRSSPVRIRSQPELGSAAMKKLMEDIALNRQVSTVEVDATAMLQFKPAAQSVEVVTYDLEAYKTQTEKEMRRLIKYGQKWKEQARRQEEENAKLRSLLENVKKENKRLQKTISQQKESTHLEVISNDALRHDKVECQMPTLEADPQETGNSEAQHATRMNGKHLQRKVSLREKLNEVQRSTRQNSTTPKGPPPKEISRSQSKSVSDGQTDKSCGTRSEADEKGILMFKSSSRAPEGGNTEFSMIDVAEQPVLQSKDTCERKKVAISMRQSSVPTDKEARLAAARERVRLKREDKARTASMPAILAAPASMSYRTSRESAKVNNDESELDWLAAA